MNRRITHHPEIRSLILKELLARVPAGVAVTDEMWNVAYDIVWSRHAAWTIGWKLENLDPNFVARFNHGR